jgi:hypothetical protein
MKRRASIIPPDVAAKIQFLSNRTCCVCRRQGKPVQIHHIDSNPTNNDIENLAVLCLDCHMQTMISGGFSRKLDATQVRLYREDWLNIVASRRARKKLARLTLAEPLKPAQPYRYERRNAAANQRVREKPVAEPLEVVNLALIDDPAAIVRFKKEWLPASEEPLHKRGVFPILDVKLRNGSGEAIPLKWLAIDVRAVRITYDSTTYHTPPVAWEYNVLLNPHEPGAKKNIKLSQAIEGGKMGRFFIIIGQLSGYGELKYADYELRFSLFYNNKQSLNLGTHKTRVPSPPFFLPGKARAIRHLKS